jgi:hypothetical protein
VHLPWDAVPRTGTYKVRRHALVDALRAGDLTQVPAPSPAEPVGATR